MSPSVRPDPVDAFLESLGHVEAPAGLADRVAERLRASGSRRPDRRPLLLGLAAALASLVLAGTAWLGSQVPNSSAAPTLTAGPSETPLVSVTPSPTPTAPPPTGTPAPPLDLGILPGAWVAIPDAPISGRQEATAVWTGSEMVVWGGVPGASIADPASEGSRGAAYDPVADAWRLLADAPIGARYVHDAAWTGAEMLVWGGFTLDNEPAGDGAAYRPSTDTWRTMAPAPFSPSGRQAAVWAGDRWLVVDGAISPGAPATLRTASYDPAADRWTALPDLEVPRLDAFSVGWTGSEVTLFAVASDDSGFLSSAFVLSPAAIDPAPSWQPLTGVPSLRINAGGAELFTGTELLVTGFDEGGGDHVLALDAASHAWRVATPPLGLGGGPSVWTGTLAIFGTGTGGMDRRTVYDPTRDGWYGLPDGEGIHREGSAAVWAGDRLLLWGGFEGEFGANRDGRAFVPDTP